MTGGENVVREVKAIAESSIIEDDATVVRKSGDDVSVLFAIVNVSVNDD